MGQLKIRFSEQINTPAIIGKLRVFLMGFSSQMHILPDINEHSSASFKDKGKLSAGLISVMPSRRTSKKPNL